MTQDLVRAALDRAVARYRPPAGVSMRRMTTRRLDEYPMRGSMSRKGHGWDHACLESWHSWLKQAWVYLARFRSRAEATPAIFASIEIFDNRQRLHSALGYRTPAEMEAGGAA